MKWVSRAVAAFALVVVIWVVITAWPAVRHGHPLYAALLLLTTVLAVLLAWRSRAARPPARGALGVIEALVIFAFVGWIAVMAWLRPFSAQQPALEAMHSDAAVVVEETPTRLIMRPTGAATGTGVFFQPGAKVEARAYAAVLRPLAEAGNTVVIIKQPLGIAFLATGAFEDARADYPDLARWVMAGHSLGGTVAAIDADAHDEDAVQPTVGLLLHASYPSSDMSDSLVIPATSIWGTQDGLATAQDIEASRADLPVDTSFVPVQGAVHAFFGDYGPQPGDGTPTITHDEARERISRSSLGFVSSLPD